MTATTASTVLTPPTPTVPLDGSTTNREHPASSDATPFTVPQEAYQPLIETLFKRLDALDEEMREVLFENSVLKKIVNGHLTPLRQSQLWSQTSALVQQSQQMYVFLRHLLKRGFATYTEEEKEATQPWTQIALRGWTPLQAWITSYANASDETRESLSAHLSDEIANDVRRFFSVEWISTAEQKRRGIPDAKIVIPPKLVVFYCPDASVPHDKLPLLHPLLALPLHPSVKVDEKGHTPLALKHARKGGDVITVLVPLPQMNSAIRNYDGRLFASSAEISGNDSTLSLFFRLISLYARVQLDTSTTPAPLNGTDAEGGHSASEPEESHAVENGSLSNPRGE